MLQIRTKEYHAICVKTKFPSFVGIFPSCSQSKTSPQLPGTIAIIKNIKTFKNQEEATNEQSKKTFFAALPNIPRTAKARRNQKVTHKKKTGVQPVKKGKSMLNYTSNSNKYHSKPPSSLLEYIVGLIEAKTNYRRRLYGNKYLMHCPAHSDKNPSLSVGVGFDGKILVHCFAGCSFHDVISSLGLKPRDLFPSTYGGIYG